MRDRRGLLLGAVAAVALAALLVFLVVNGSTKSGDGDVPSADPTPTTTAVTTQASTTSTTFAERGQGAIVAVNAAGQVVLLDADSGATRFVLLDGIDVSDPAMNAITLSPAEGAAYVVRPGATPADAEIVRVPVIREQASELVSKGMAPAVSPDGSLLAYVQITGEGRDQVASLVIRTLTTKKEQRFSPALSSPAVAIADVAWSPSGNSVLFTAGDEQLALFSLDATKATTLDDAKRLGPPEGTSDQSWFAVASFGGRLAVGERTGLGRSASYRVLEVDLAGTPQGPLLAAVDPFARIDGRTGGGVLLFVADMGPGGGRLMRARPGDAPEELASAIIAATW